MGYARVSFHDQKADLPRQSQPLRQHAGADMVLVKDIGSGLNYRKPGLKKLLALLVSGSVRELVLSYKDRLLHFGSELVFQLCSLLGIKVTVLDDAAPKFPEAAFADDVLAIITVFSAKLYGARSSPTASSSFYCSTLPILTRDCLMPRQHAGRQSRAEQSDRYRRRRTRQRRSEGLGPKAARTTR